MPLSLRPRLPVLLTLAAAVCFVSAASAASAQRASAPLARPAEAIVSMGQPPRWQPYVAVLGDVAGDRAGAAASLVVGVHRPFFNPVSGMLSATAEGWGETGTHSSAGARLLATIPLLGFGSGVDWSARAHRVDALLTWQTAIARGGIVGHGSAIRVDWLPTRGHALRVGLALPVGQPFAGRTRPRRTTVPLPGAAAPSLSAASAVSAAAFDAIARDARLLLAYTSLRADDASEVAADLARGDSGGYTAVEARYHERIAAAFRAAAPALDAPTLDRALSHARDALLEHVLIAYDSLFGRPKTHDDVSGLLARAQESFRRWLSDSTTIPESVRDNLLATNARWLAVVGDAHRDLRGRWRDSRTVWLPLQLALPADAFDEQPEVDSLIARLVGRPFTDENSLTYLRSSDLPLEIARSIYAARSYHVLWLHDFAGRRISGAVDDVGYSMVADAYLPALTAAVQRYDSTGVFPQYFIFLDQYFYEPTDGRLWLTILDDPMHASMALPDHDPGHEAHLRERAAALRAAVASSHRLQREAAAHGGERWLRSIVRIHVNVTEPSDFSFRSAHILPRVPFAPDNLMRDHRKIVFYDLDEADPTRGEMLLMGVGIGEHYASATWEDRGFRLRGPAALEARAAARRVLRNNGIPERDLPATLRAVAYAPPDTIIERRADRGAYVGRALQLHNETGFGAKRSSIARAALYTLTPPGSVLIVPDPLWLSDSWAAMLVAAAARGSRVMIVGPALKNAPSPQPPLMATEHDLFSSLLATRRVLSAGLARAGGALDIGIFAARAPVTDVAGRLREIRAGLTRAPWIRDVIPFDDATLAALDRTTATTNAETQAAAPRATDVAPRPPQLHQKTQLIARPGAIAALLRQPGWDETLVAAMQAQAAQTARFGAELGAIDANPDTAAIRRSDARLRAYESSLPPGDRRRLSFYFSLGTQNEDPRGLFSDGEASVIVSGAQASVGLVDLFFLSARSEWITTESELDRYVPKPSGFWRAIGRAIRATL